MHNFTNFKLHIKTKKQTEPQNHSFPKYTKILKQNPGMCWHETCCH